MSLHFEKVRVKKITRETPDCVSVLFDIPENLFDHFAYKPGQHLTLRAFINNADTRRSYSLCSAPQDKEWKVAIKKIDGGIFSSFVNDTLKEGDELELMPPMGHFYHETTTNNKQHYVFIAAGSGITPVLSNIKNILNKESNSTVTLLYGNRNRNSIIFKEELEALKNKYMQRLSIIYTLSREATDAPVNHGRIDAEKCAMLFGRTISLHADKYFICGPEEMIFTVKSFLQDKGVAENKIHFELFTPSTAPAAKKKENTITDNTAKSNIIIKQDGIEFSFNMPFNDEKTLLDTAIEKGADLPYSCKGGVCCTCKARLLEGEVSMDVHWGLEEEEVEQGYILTCQSHPITEKIVLDFDIK